MPNPVRRAPFSSQIATGDISPKEVSGVVAVEIADCVRLPIRTHAGIRHGGFSKGAAPVQPQSHLAIRSKGDVDERIGVGVAGANEL
jgi:hypothetical protein